VPEILPPPPATLFRLHVDSITSETKPAATMPVVFAKREHLGLPPDRFIVLIESIYFSDGS
jgi:hypothetical protein